MRAPTADLWGQLTGSLRSGADPQLAEYSAEPARFAREVLKSEPWDGQERILAAVRDDVQTTVRSSHGVGKTWVAAAAGLWWCYCHRPSLVLTTAPTARQVEAQLWGEINRLWRRARLPSGAALPGRCLNVKLQASGTQEAVGLTTDEPEKFAGWHSEHLLVIVDEASGVPDSLFEVIAGTMTSAHCRLLLIGNPTRTTGHFHKSHHSPGWSALKVAAPDTPNFTALPGSPPPMPWLVTREWVELRRREWGEDSDAFRVRVMGEFPRSAGDTLIAWEWCEAAQSPERHAALSPDREDDNETVLGIDIARYGECESVGAVRIGPALVALERWSGSDLMASCGRVVELVREYQPERLVIDDIGVGGGVKDRLEELQAEGLADLASVTITGFPAGGPPLSDDGFHLNRRAEAYGQLRDRFRDGNLWLPPECDTLKSQLCSLKKLLDSRGRLKIESKEDMRRRKMPSPDQADAVMMAFAPFAPAFFVPVALGNNRQSEAVYQPRIRRGGLA